MSNLSFIKQTSKQLQNPTGFPTNLTQAYSIGAINLDQLYTEGLINLQLMYTLESIEDITDLLNTIAYYPYTSINLINNINYSPKGNLTLQFIDAVSSTSSIIEEDSFLVNHDKGYSLILGNTVKSFYSSIRYLLDIYNSMSKDSNRTLKISSSLVPLELPLNSERNIKNIEWINFLEKIVNLLNLYTPRSIKELIQTFGNLFTSDFKVTNSHPIDIFDIDSLLMLLNNDLLPNRQARREFTLCATAQAKKTMIKALYRKQQAAKGVFLLPEYNTLLTEKGMSAVDKLKSNPHISQKLWTEGSYHLCKVEKGEFRKGEGKSYLILFEDGFSLNAFPFSSFYTTEGQRLTTKEITPGTTLDITKSAIDSPSSGVVAKVIFNEEVDTYYKITLPQFIYPKKIVTGSGIIQGITTNQNSGNEINISDLTVNARFLEYFYSNTVAVHNGYFFKVNLNLLQLPDITDPEFTSLIQTAAILSCYSLRITADCPSTKLLDYLNENPHVCVNFINIHRYLYHKLGGAWVKWLAEGRPETTALINVELDLPIELHHLITRTECTYYNSEKKILRGPQGFIYKLAERIHCRYLTYLIRLYINNYCLNEDIPIPTKYSMCQLNHKYLNRQYRWETIVDLVINLQNSLSTYLITYPLELPADSTVLNKIESYKTAGYVIPNFKFLD